METKFTPGPWRIGRNCGAVVADTEEGICIPGAFGDDAKEYYGGYLVGESISPGNSALIAAAPELLEALENAWLMIILGTSPMMDTLQP